MLLSDTRFYKLIPSQIIKYRNKKTKHEVIRKIIEIIKS